MATMEELRRTIGDFARGQVTGSTPTPVGKVNLRGTPGFKVQLSDAGQAVKSPAFKKMATTAAGRGALVGAEAAGAYNDMNNLQGIEKVQRVGESVGRLGGAAAGAALGAMSPIPGGALVGGGLGYFAPEAVKMLANTITGNQYELPSEKSARLSAPKVDMPLAEKYKPAMASQEQSNFEAPSNEVPLIRGGGMDMPVQATQPSAQQTQMDAIRQLITESRATRGQQVNPLQQQSSITPVDFQGGNPLGALMQLQGAVGEAVGRSVGNRMANKQADTLLKEAGAEADILKLGDTLKASELQQKNTQANIEKSGLDIEQGRMALDTQKQLREILQQYASEKDPTKRQELANIALTLQGKEPKLPFEFKEAGDSLTGKVLYRINNRTGDAQVVGGNQQQAQPSSGELRQDPSGRWLRFNDKTQTYEPA